MASTFTVDGVEYAVKSPSIEDSREADKVYNRKMRDALDSKAMMRAVAEKHIKEQGIWTDEKEAESKELQKKIVDLELILTVKGGVKLSQAKEIALEIRKLRLDMAKLYAEKNSLMRFTAEAQADDERFNFLVSRCVVYNDNKKPYFKDFADYLAKSNGEIAQKGAELLISQIYGLGNYDDNLAENKFLKKYGFVDSKYRLVNKEGHLVDREGRLIDEDGSYIAYKDGVKIFVDKFGNEVTEQGDYIGEPAPFLDEDGNPINE